MTDRHRILNDQQGISNDDVVLMQARAGGHGLIYQAFRRSYWARHHPCSISIYPWPINGFDHPVPLTVPSDPWPTPPNP